MLGEDQHYCRTSQMVLNSGSWAPYEGWMIRSDVEGVGEDVVLGSAPNSRSTSSEEIELGLVPVMVEEGEEMFMMKMGE